MKLKVAEKKKLLIEAGFEPPGAFVRGRDGVHYDKMWCVPKSYLKDIGDSPIDKLTTGRLMSFEEAWAHYEGGKR